MRIDLLIMYCWVWMYACVCVAPAWMCQVDATALISVYLLLVEVGCATRAPPVY